MSKAHQVTFCLSSDTGMKLDVRVLYLINCRLSAYFQCRRSTVEQTYTLTSARSIQILHFRRPFLLLFKLDSFGFECTEDVAVLCCQIHVMTNIQQQHNLNRTHLYSSLIPSLLIVRHRALVCTVAAHCICLGYYCELLPVGLTRVIAKHELSFRNQSIVNQMHGKRKE